MADGMPNESMVAQTPAKSEKDSEKPSATPGSVLKKSSTKAKAAPKTAPKEKAKNKVIKKSTVSKPKPPKSVPEPFKRPSGQEQTWQSWKVGVVPVPEEKDKEEEA